MSDARFIMYQAREDATAEGELAALAACYRFLLNCHERKKAAHSDGPDNAEDLQSDRIATKNYTG
jgi:hypothetical protein